MQIILPGPNSSIDAPIRHRIDTSYKYDSVHQQIIVELAMGIDHGGVWNEYTPQRMTLPKETAVQLMKELAYYLGYSILPQLDNITPLLPTITGQSD